MLLTEGPGRTSHCLASHCFEGRLAPADSQPVQPAMLICQGPHQARYPTAENLWLHRRRPFIQDPTSLVPQLPSPQDLRPFPHRLLLRFLGHSGPVRSPELPAVEHVSVLVLCVSKPALLLDCPDCCTYEQKASCVHELPALRGSHSIRAIIYT